jgi:hypothetical protein
VGEEKPTIREDHQTGPLPIDPGRYMIDGLALPQVALKARDLPATAHLDPHLALGRRDVSAKIPLRGLFADGLSAGGGGGLHFLSARLLTITVDMLGPLLAVPPAQLGNALRVAIPARLLRAICRCPDG